MSELVRTRTRLPSLTAFTHDCVTLSPGTKYGEMTASSVCIERSICASDLHDLGARGIVLAHRGLERIVGGEVVPVGPLHRPVARHQALHRIVGAQDVRVAAGTYILEAVRELRPQRLECGGVDTCRVEQLHRVRRRRIPVPVERRRRVADDRPDHREVEVDEVDLVTRAEVLVTQVAATHYRDAVVRDPGLVVHPVVDPTEACQALAHQTHRARARCEGIEHPHADVPVRGKCCEAHVL